MFAVLFLTAIAAHGVIVADVDVDLMPYDGSVGRENAAVDAGRYGGEAAGNGTYDGVQLVGALKDGFRRPKRECTKSGCHKGYCWAYCSIGAQWCYTTKSYSQSYRYESCTADSQCSCWWSCAGSCTV